MPYITCPNGRTYSRYDQSEYVKWCICQENEYYRQQHLKCMKDPECKAKYDSNQKFMKGFIGVSAAILLIGFFILFRTFLKLID